MDYDRYAKIRDALFKRVHFAIINQMFCNGNAYFQFWDESYIPEPLKQYILRPPRKSETVEEVKARKDAETSYHNEILEALMMEPVVQKVTGA